MSMNVTVLFREKKITFSFDPLPVLIVLRLISFLLQKSLLSPFFPKYIPLIQKSLLLCLFLRSLLSVLVSFVNSHCIFNLPFPQYDPWRGRFYFSYLSSSQCSFQPGSHVINSTVAVLFGYFGQTKHFAFWTWVHWNLFHVCHFNS